MNEIALKRAEEIAQAFGLRGDGSKAPDRFRWKDWSGNHLGNSGGMATPAVQPSGGGFLDKIGGIVGDVAGAYAAREISEQQARNARLEMEQAIELQRMENERLIIQAENARAAAEATRAQQELMRADEMLRNSGLPGDIPWTMIGIAGLGTVLMFRLLSA